MPGCTWEASLCRIPTMVRSSSAEIRRGCTLDRVRSNSPLGPSIRYRRHQVLNQSRDRPRIPQTSSTDRPARRNLIACWRSESSLSIVASVRKPKTVVTHSNYSGKKHAKIHDRFRYVITHRQKCNRCTGGSIHVDVTHAVAVECYLSTVGPHLPPV